METKRRSLSGSSNSGQRSGDLARLKVDGTATMEELQEFVGQMRGKKPADVMGLVAQSGLASGIVMATIGSFLLLIVFTVIPYYLGGGDEDVAKKADTSRQSAASGNAPAGEAGDAAATPDAPETDTSAAEEDPALGALGIGETKQAPADKNPLENSLDNLLDAP